mgnify:CR=1 FL=1
MLKLFAGAIGASALALSALLVLAGPALAAFAVQDLNIRTGPGTGFARVGVIPGGQNVQVLGCQGGWCQVNYRGIVGWASGSYLADGGPYRPAPPPAYGVPPQPGYAAPPPPGVPVGPIYRTPRSWGRPLPPPPPVY